MHLGFMKHALLLTSAVFLSVPVSGANVTCPEYCIWCSCSKPKIAPKVLIFSLFPSEADIWYQRWSDSGFDNLNAVQTSAPGLCMLYPHVHCTPDHSVCQVTTGMGEINAAATAMALGLSPKFDLTSTYFLISGIAGVNPLRGTLGSVGLAKYAVQVALQYEIDSREIPSDWAMGYVAYGTKKPLQYPSILYGTEVFELNEALRDAAFLMASNATLADSEAAGLYRAKYSTMGDVTQAATSSPAVVKCDTATSDVYYSGKMLSEGFEKVSQVWTNGSAQYCMTASEDSAILEVLMRLAIEGLVDFGRVMVMRSDGITAYEHLLTLDQNGFSIAINNLYNAGIRIVQGIVKNWNCTYEKGLSPTNYIGDIWGSLGGQPSFGPGSITGGYPIKAGGQTGNLMRRGMTGADFAKGHSMMQR
ncbi:hypothetical protein CFO_g1620 [Ceratocystis platani]|uniref:Purine nucleoside permease n=1 Tax=Ceratocystis fimbriata f. sp. platani TaxID=88771 RepID=A0A0F8B3A5_CERFI|nr:hypothetical protein CFO_g1620 [Ceratocystis platani]